MNMDWIKNLTKRIEIYVNWNEWNHRLKAPKKEIIEKENLKHKKLGFFKEKNVKKDRKK